MAQEQSGYESFVRSLARDSPSFKALQAFLELKDSPSSESLQSTITYIDFQADDDLTSRTIHQTELKSVAIRGVKRLFIVENLSAETTITLGDAFNIDPQFFLDFINAIPAEWDITKSPERARPNLVPKPWYNFEKADGHLPMLNSIRLNNHHIAIRYIGPREYQNTKDRRNLDERVKPDLDKMVVERIAGLHRPVSRAGKDFDIVAMTRHMAAVWFAPRPDEKADWTTGIIVLDPPFEAKDSAYGQRMQSIYLSILPSPLAPTIPTAQVDRRNSYRESLSLYLEQDRTLRGQGSYTPMAVLEGLARIISSECIVVGTYFERDLNSINWELETTNVHSENHEKFLKSLYTLHRRNDRLMDLAQHWHSLLGNGMPLAWQPATSGPVSSRVMRDMKQVEDILSRNSRRISETTNLITTLMQVQEGGRSLNQNRWLGFLTIIATLVLPFNAVAAFFGIDFDGPKWKTGTFVNVLLVSLAAEIVVVIVYWVGLKLYWTYRARRN